MAPRGGGGERPRAPGGAPPPDPVEIDPALEIRDGDAEDLGAPDRPDGRDGGLGVVTASRGGPHPAQQHLVRARSQPVGVAEHLDRLGTGEEELPGEAARAERVGEDLGGLPLVPEQPEVPMGAPELLADLAEGEQPGVRVRHLGEPLEHDRQQLALDGGPPTHALGKDLDVPQRSGRVAVAERTEPLTGRVGGEPGLGWAEPRDGGEQRTVEEPLVEATHLARVTGTQVDDPRLRLVPEVEGATETAQVVLAPRHEVGPPQVMKLHTVLDGAQHPVGLVEDDGVLAPDVSARRQPGQRLEGGARAKGPVRAAVDELEELDGELHVPQAPGAELELALRLCRGDVVLDPSAHPLDVVDEVFARGRLPHHGPDGLEVVGAQRRVTGEVARLEQRLELPGLGPPLVVGAVAGDGAHEGALLALGAQGGVDLPQAAVGGDRGAGVHRPGRDARSHVESLLLVLPVRGFGDEDHVDVRDVVQLPPTRLAHADDGQPDPTTLLALFFTGDADRRLECRAGEVRERGGGLGQLGDRVLARDIECRDREQLATIGHPHRVLRLQVPRRGDLREHRLGTLLRRHRGRVHRIAPLPRVSHEVVHQGRGRAEDADDAVADLLVLTQGLTQLPRAVPGGLEHPHQPEQCPVGVGGPGQRPDEAVLLDARGQVEHRIGEQALGTPGVGEPPPGERRCGSLRWCHDALTAAAGVVPARRG